MAEESHNETLSENPVKPTSNAAVRTIFLAKPQQAEVPAFLGPH
jgi:hypothetical protein